ncbi:ATP-dependent helicase [Corynebacterium freiburgense]|uniref:ATP-dependent helicase n=1 Tax=Corynebacterium freiburgense TaxID=556548 RepID=UPI0004195294|nr:UvrD-helicase domain-containing protein [Corynebacterium freiburgense]WJZ01946.1 ATP-dependent DNA helicase UvrD1 [Corynebacterium freiburgense]
MSNRISPQDLSIALGQEFPPTEQQGAVIGAPPGPMLVVAGAGAGKTETMAARVVWLVANGFATPEQVLGLTFTRKAAQQLSQRIRGRLGVLAGIDALRDIDPTGKLAANLQAITPTVATYDSFAGRVVGEFGLLLPVEPSARVITQTELFQIAWDLVRDYGGSLNTTSSPASVADTLLQLTGSIDNHMVTLESIYEETEPLLRLFHELPKAPRQRDVFSKTTQNIYDRQQLRLEFLPLVRALKEELSRRNVVTFGEQMSMAARLARDCPRVRETLRRRFRVVMLDEYQDTSHAQRELLRSLFGGQDPVSIDPDLTVTAVGDPMQSIYGWRGATAANLARFVEDFQTITPDGRCQNAPKMELTTSWRNPPEVLELANAVASTVLGPANAPDRTVQPLSPRPNAKPGKVHLGWFDTFHNEQSWVADQLAREYRERKAEGKKFTGAVLVRKNRHSASMAAQLQARGIPVEVVSLSGLLDVPEVADMIAFASMLVNPLDTASALRILAGPHVGLGAKDLLALGERVANLAGRAKEDRPEPASDPLERLHQIVAETVRAEPEAQVGLADAVADLGEQEKYTPEGYERLMEVAAELRHIRTRSLSQPLPDLFADIERVLGIRTEVLARQDPNADGAAGTVHLDRLAEEVHAYALIPGATLKGLLAYFQLAKAKDKGLTRGEVQVRADRVQILTAHSAKGLEWDVVSVLHAANTTYEDDVTKRAKVDTWVTQVAEIPSTLRGDADTGDGRGGAPVLDIGFAENRKELEEAIQAHKEEFKTGLFEETTRLFYVALTRSERVLYVTGSMVSETGTTGAPYVGLELLRQQAPNAVVHWFEGFDAEDIAEPEQLQGVFPASAFTVNEDAVLRGAALVKDALEQPDPPNMEGDIETLWEREVSALIEEQQRLAAPVLEVEIARELTASDMVALKQNPEHYAQRIRRPVPFKPNAYAKRGTALHQWIEDRYGLQALWDEEQLFNKEDQDIATSELEHLKQKFLESPWADTTPAFIEHPFEVSVGRHIVRGRMDAVFRDVDTQGGWIVVDWKTGGPPKGKDMRAAMVQLAVYRHAWAQLRGIDPSLVRAAFHYVGWNHTFEPDYLPQLKELEAMLE